MSGATISMVHCVTDAATRDSDVARVIEWIRTGGKESRALIENIRRIYQRELCAHGDRAKAKRAVEPAEGLKRQVCLASRPSFDRHTAKSRCALR